MYAPFFFSIARCISSVTRAPGGAKSQPSAIKNPIELDSREIKRVLVVKKKSKFTAGAVKNKENSKTKSLLSFTLAKLN